MEGNKGNKPAIKASGKIVVFKTTQNPNMELPRGFKAWLKCSHEIVIKNGCFCYDKNFGITQNRNNSKIAGTTVQELKNEFILIKKEGKKEEIKFNRKN
jgi:hypothetical protein